MRITHRIERLVMGGAEDQEKHPDVWAPEGVEGSEEFCHGWLAHLQRACLGEPNYRIVEIPPKKTALNVSNADLAFAHAVLGKCLTLFRNRGNQQGALQDEIVEAMSKIGEAP